jgi:hypothetical protein
MRLWPRALLVGAAVVAAAALLKAAPPIVVLLVFVAGVGGAAWWIRSETRRRTADEVVPGLRREAADPFGIVAYPLALFTRAAEPAVEDVAWGRWRTLDVHAFSLSFAPRGPAGAGADRARLSCAMGRTEAELPPLVCEPQAFATQLEPPTSMGAVETGDAAFDEGMRVWCGDEAARALLDAPMRAWLRTLDLRWAAEVGGHLVIVYAQAPDRPDVWSALDVLQGLLHRLPGGSAATGNPAV